jgi:hypothetical protein
VILPDGTIIRPGDDGVPPVIGPGGTITFNVTFALTAGATFSGGAASVTVGQTYGRAYVLPSQSITPPVNRTFLQWTAADSGAVIAAGTLVGPDAAGQTIYSVWAQVPYIVTLVPYGGINGTESVEVLQGQPMPTQGLIAPTRNGYTFGGYYDTVSGDNQYYTAALASAKNWDKASGGLLFARWTPVAVSYQPVPENGWIIVTNGVPFSRPGVLATAAAGGSAITYTRDLGSSLPPGVGVNTSGDLSGTPGIVAFPTGQHYKAYEVTILATAANGSTASVAWNIIVVEPGYDPPTAPNYTEIRASFSSIEVDEEGNVSLGWNTYTAGTDHTVIEARVALNDAAGWVRLTDGQLEGYTDTGAVVPATTRGAGNAGFHFFRRFVRILQP